jgi:phospholipid/cholesterol/gamma-HCH transport system ATP-binding protein
MGVTPMTAALTLPTASPPATAPLIRLEGVGIHFGAQEVLRDLTMGLERGRTTVVIGESGCGKTVFLKLVIALLRPTAGRIYFDERCLVELPEKELTRQRLRFGYVFQGAALFDSLSVFENVAFPLREHRRARRDEIRAAVERATQEVGLAANLLDKKPAELSGGQRKRVGLARALIYGPEVMLYDEPTTGLDPIMTDVINDLIIQTKTRHPVTSIVVTHDMKTVMKVAERVIMLAPLAKVEAGESQILFDGDAAELAVCSDARVQQFIQGTARG